MYDNEDGESAPRGQVERRHKPFVPDPNRVAYPVDHVTSQGAAVARFEAESRIVVGGQLTRRIVDEACDLEDEIRGRVHDGVQYAALSVVLGTFLADAIEVRHDFMNPGDEPRYRR